MRGRWSLPLRRSSRGSWEEEEAVAEAAEAEEEQEEVGEAEAATEEGGEVEEELLTVLVAALPLWFFCCWAVALGSRRRNQV